MLGDHAGRVGGAGRRGREVLPVATRGGVLAAQDVERADADDERGSSSGLAAFAGAPERPCGRASAFALLLQLCRLVHAARCASAARRAAGRASVVGPVLAQQPVGRGRVGSRPARPRSWTVARTSGRSSSVAGRWRPGLPSPGHDEHRSEDDPEHDARPSCSLGGHGA